MYPFLRLWWHTRRARQMPPMDPFDVHRTVTHVLPWDIDPFFELNNGRTLTLYDLGRIPMLNRLNVRPGLATLGWRPTVAGQSVRYRRRICAFDRLEMASRILGWDPRFFYIEQSLWRGGECCNHVVVRIAFTTGAGILPTDEVATAAGWPRPSPALPDWVQAWAEAEAQRPWPPTLPQQ